MSNSTQEKGFDEGRLGRGLAEAKPHLLKGKVSRAGLEPATRRSKTASTPLNPKANQPMTVIGRQHDISVLHLKMNLLTGARFEMNAL